MSDDSRPDLLSIGDVADATGISVGTLRVWERRYDRPKPVRLSSRHRRYTVDHVRWLRRVAEALSRGHRPSMVVPLSEQELDDLLAPTAEEPGDHEAIERLLELVIDLRGGEIRKALREDFERLGPQELLRRRVTPLVTRVGRLWADGKLEIRHEHFLSEVLEDFLRTQRLGLPDGDGPVVLLATLSGEAHGLGLHMAALVAAGVGVDARILGTEIPNREIVVAVEETGAVAVCVSVSLSTGGPATDRVLADLRRRLPIGVRLVIGGRGARGARGRPRGADYLNDLKDLENWLKN